MGDLEDQKPSEKKVESPGSGDTARTRPENLVKPADKEIFERNKVPLSPAVAQQIGSDASLLALLEKSTTGANDQAKSGMDKASTHAEVNPMVKIKRDLEHGDYAAREQAAKSLELALSKDPEGTVIQLADAFKNGTRIPEARTRLEAALSTYAPSSYSTGDFFDQIKGRNDLVPSNLKTASDFQKMLAKEGKEPNKVQSAWSDLLKNAKLDIPANVAKNADQYLRDLNKLGALSGVKSLNLSGTNITHVGLKELENLKQLEELDLGDTAVTGGELEPLKQLANLKKLSLKGLDVTNAKLDVLETFYKLEDFDLSDTRSDPKADQSIFNRAAFERIMNHLPNIKRLNLSGSPVNDLKGLNSLSRLEELDLQMTDIGNDDLNYLKDHCPNLRRLNLSITNVTDAGLAALQNHHKLEELNLSALDYQNVTQRELDRGIQGLRRLENRSKFTDAGLKALDGLIGLKSIDLSGTKVTDQGFNDLITHMPNLEKVKINSTAITDTGLAALADLGELKELDISDTKITDAGLHHLAAYVPKLTTLNLSMLGKITDRSLTSFVERHHRLTNLDLCRTNVTDITLSALKQCPELESLKLRVTKVTDSGMTALNALRKLKELEISGPDISDTGLKNLTGILPQLERLNINFTQVTDAGLLALQHCTKLQYLDLDGTKMTDNGLLALQHYTKLQNLSLSYTNITDAGIINSANHLTNLRELNLDHVEQFTDKGMSALPYLTHLENVDFTATGITVEGLKFLQGLPMLKHINTRKNHIADDDLDQALAEGFLGYRARLLNITNEWNK